MMEEIVVLLVEGSIHPGGRESAERCKMLCIKPYQ